MATPGQIAVQTELVKEYIVDRMVEAALRRLRDPIEGAASRAIAVLDAGINRDIARAGYFSRVIEAEMFERARAVASMPGQGHDIAASSRELAALEPAGRPDPFVEGWTSWRVPGPGGHVRHHVAVECAERMTGGTSPELKQCWMYGFYVRCYEETARQAEAAAGTDGVVAASTRRASEPGAGEEST